MWFTFLVREESEFFDHNTGAEYLIDLPCWEAREWLEERVGPADRAPFVDLKNKRPGTWDVVYPDRYRGLDPDRCLVVRMDTDDVTAVEFKLRWG